MYIPKNSLYHACARIEDLDPYEIVNLNAVVAYVSALRPRGGRIFTIDEVEVARVARTQFANLQTLDEVRVTRLAPVSRQVLEGDIQ